MLFWAVAEYRDHYLRQLTIWLYLASFPLSQKKLTRSLFLDSSRSLLLFNSDPRGRHTIQIPILLISLLENQIFTHNGSKM